MKNEYQKTVRFAARLSKGIGRLQQFERVANRVLAALAGHELAESPRVRESVRLIREAFIVLSAVRDDRDGQSQAAKLLLEIDAMAAVTEALAKFWAALHAEGTGFVDDIPGIRVTDDSLSEDLASLFD